MMRRYARITSAWEENGRCPCRERIGETGMGRIGETVLLIKAVAEHQLFLDSNSHLKYFLYLLLLPSTFYLLPSTFYLLVYS